MTEKELLDQGYRKYSGIDIDVYFRLETCIHSGNCVRGLKDVFDTKRKPWITPDNASSQKVMETINNCPSGALKYILKNKEDKSMFHHHNRRFYLNNDENQMIAEVTYTEAGTNILIIDHTFVDPSLRGQGVGGKLIEEVVKLAIKDNKKIVPLCPFAKKVFEQTPSYQLLWHK